MEGDVVTGSVMAGQIAGLISKEQSCYDIIQEIVKEAESLISNFRF
jgi:enoyl-[acyl-carrier protein] reductase II